jgi:parallel beta-helix repeat protein
VRDNSVHENHLSGIQLAANASGNRIDANRINGNGLYGVEVGRGRGQRGTGDGQPRQNDIVGNRIYGSGTENLHRDQPALNHYVDNSFEPSSAISPPTFADAAHASAP